MPTFQSFRDLDRFLYKDSLVKRISDNLSVRDFVHVLSTEPREENPKIGKIAIACSDNYSGAKLTQDACLSEGFEIVVSSFDGQQSKNTFLATKSEEMYWVSVKEKFLHGVDNDEKFLDWFFDLRYYEINIE